MSVRGWATAVKLVNQGSELTADAAVSAATLAVDWLGDFNDAGGTLRLNDVDLEYIAVDRTAETITLAVPLAVAATDGDRVDVVTSGQVIKDYTMFVTLGVGDDAQVDIPFGDRDAWPEGDYDEPVEVLLSDDLERIEAVPGVMPVRRIIGGYIATTGDDETQRFVIYDDGDGGVIEAYSGVPDEVPGTIDPRNLGGAPAIEIASGTNATFTDTASFYVQSGIASGSRFDVFASNILLAAAVDVEVLSLLKADSGISVASDAVLLTTGGHVLADGDVKAQGAVFSPALPTGVGSPVVMRSSDGRIHIDSSSRRFKENVESADEAEIVEALLQIVTKTYTRNDGDDPEDPRRFLGTIAEEVADAGLEYLVNRDVDGLPFSINQGAMVTALLAGFRAVHAENTQLRADHAALADRVSAMEAPA